MKGFNSKTQLNKQFKLADLARSLTMSREEKDEFKQLESLTLTHALNAETTGLKATEAVEIIYIYNIKTKTKDIPLKFMRALDKKTKTHTLFEVMTRDGECLTAEEAKTPHLYKDKMWNCRNCMENCGATYTYILGNKRIGDKIVIGEYIENQSFTEWELPQGHKAESLEDLYGVLLSLVINLKRRSNESADDLSYRRKRITELEKEVEKLERKKDSEKQLNKKIAINEEIRALMAQIEGEK